MKEVSYSLRKLREKYDQIHKAAQAKYCELEQLKVSPIQALTS
jgi:hypothetical protein